MIFSQTLRVRFECLGSAVTIAVTIIGSGVTLAISPTQQFTSRPALLAGPLVCGLVADVPAIPTAAGWSEQ